MSCILFTQFIFRSNAKLAVIGLGFLSFASVMLQFGFPLIYLSQVDSSNNYIAKYTDLQSLAEGTAIMAYEQTAGRGQFGKHWHMEAGKDLSVSYLIRPDLSINSSFILNKAIALAVRDCVNQITEMATSIKWPNDIFLNGRKIAGLLIEPVWQGDRCKHVVIGIGLNVNGKYSAKDFNAISLFESNGMEFEIEQVFDSLSTCLSIRYAEFLKGSFREIEEHYDAAHLGIGEQIEFSPDNGHDSIAGVLRGIDSTGRILIESGTSVQAFVHGRIRIDYSGIVGQ